MSHHQKVIALADFFSRHVDKRQLDKEEEKREKKNKAWRWNKILEASSTHSILFSWTNGERNKKREKNAQESIHNGGQCFKKSGPLCQHQQTMPWTQKRDGPVSS